jgi:XRE family aerobic/anaerobic benzoate catabolism transcriptional regulator
LKSILASRSVFYSKAEHQLDTSAQPLLETFQILRAEVRGALRLPS